MQKNPKIKNTLQERVLGKKNTILVGLEFQYQYEFIQRQILIIIFLLTNLLS